jgi:hypothetical protein
MHRSTVINFTHFIVHDDKKININIKNKIKKRSFPRCVKPTRTGAKNKAAKVFRCWSSKSQQNRSKIAAKSQQNRSKIAAKSHRCNAAVATPSPLDRMPGKLVL